MSNSDTTQPCHSVWSHSRISKYRLRVDLSVLSIFISDHYLTSSLWGPTSSTILCALDLLESWGELHIRTTQRSIVTLNLRIKRYKSPVHRLSFWGQSRRRFLSASHFSSNSFTFQVQLKTALARGLCFKDGSVPTVYGWTAQVGNVSIWEIICLLLFGS